jgi:beta-lactam-binding protein with PASTA domain
MWMKSYTKHGTSLSVPNFVGMDIEDAIRASKKNKLNLLVIDSSTYNPKVEGGVILEQSPVPDSKVKEQRSIYLTISKYIPNDVVLPELVGNYDATNYARKLQRKGLKSQISKKIFDANLQPNTILYIMIDGKKLTDDDISKGVSASEGTMVDLVVTEQSGTFTDLPDLNCLTFSEAKFIITTYNLNVGSIINDATVKDQKNAYVWKQRPVFSAGRTIDIGAPIDLFLTQFKPSTCN